MSSPAPTIRILPQRSVESTSAEELLARAEALGIPWRRLLAQEIEAEQRLRSYLPDVPADCPWDAALEILSTESARSWRVRDELETRAWQARASIRDAARSLRGFIRSVAGESGSDRADPSAVRRCGMAYRRI